MTDPETNAQLTNSPLLAGIVLGYPVHDVSLQSATETVLALAEQKQSVQVVTLNPEMIIKGEQHYAFGQILKQATLCLPDGAGVVWALRQGGKTLDRVPGIEFSETLLATLNHHRFEDSQRSVALVGASENVLSRTLAELQSRYPHLKFVYSHHGFFEEGRASEKIAQEAAEQNPQLVLVALGVPRQELWIQQHRPLFRAGTIFVGVGGSFDVWSGTLQRAPQWMRLLPLEWLWRFSLQPWRIQRAAGPILRFMLRVLTEKNAVQTRL